jgi:preprotein translocase subunit SecG
VDVYLRIVLMVVSVVLIALVMLQARGSGLAGMFGGDGGVYKTRRGVEKTVYNATVVFSAIFLSISLVIVLIDTP